LATARKLDIGKLTRKKRSKLSYEKIKKIDTSR